MKMTLRWFGKSDPVTLGKIRQIPGVTGIVSALYDVPAGDIWTKEKLIPAKEEIELAGLDFSVVESMSVHENIKLGLPSRDRFIDNYCRSIQNIGELGIPVLCYNFMPVFDWTRTDLVHRLDDGSTTSCYQHQDLNNIDLSDGIVELPGWATGYSREQLSKLLAAYKSVEEEQLWDHLAYFLERIIPVATESGVSMAIHPDDPPWSIFGLPRIMTNEAALQRLLELVDLPANGLTFCTGSLGPNPNNDLPNMIRWFGGQGRIHFAHSRNIRIVGEKCFEETPHISRFGSVDMYEVMKAYNEVDFIGPIRPDHGRMIWGETGRTGYGLYDRALGAMYLQGLIEAIKKGAGTV